MQSVIIYASRNPGKDRVAVNVQGSDYPVYIRAVAYEGDVSDALDHADPFIDESVSNSHSLDGVEYAGSIEPDDIMDGRQELHVITKEKFSILEMDGEKTRRVIFPPNMHYLLDYAPDGGELVLRHVRTHDAPIPFRNLDFVSVEEFWDKFRRV